MSALIDALINQGYLKHLRIIKAFQKVPRFYFLPKTGESENALKTQAEINAPLSIGFNQTISQPLTVALMLELLAPGKGNKILDVGSGSAWQSCLLTYIVGEKGKVYALEIIPELKKLGEKNARHFHFPNLQFILSNGYQGYPKEAPYDRVIVAAVASKVPEPLKAQLKIGGIMVIPIGEPDDCILTRIKKINETKFEIKKVPGFSFVPLVKN